MLNWLPLSAIAVIFLPSTTRLTWVSRPSQCAVGPSLKSKEEWCLVNTHSATLVVGFPGRVHHCCLDPPLRSLNISCATCRKSPSEGNPSQSGQMCHTQNTCVSYIGNCPLLWSCIDSILLFVQTRTFPIHQTWGLVGTAPLPQKWPPSSRCGISPVLIPVEVC